MTRTKLSLDALSVESFTTGEADADLRGTVNAHGANPSRNCNTRLTICTAPSLYEICPISDVECS